MADYFTAEAFEAQFELTLPERFKRFLAEERLKHTGKLADLPSYAEPMVVHFDGDDLESFINDDWPAEGYGHPYATEIDFDEFPGHVILATIGEGEAQVLMCDVSKPGCPVFMWEHETNEADPVADSLDEFLESLTNPES